jgi:hypothetical protein
VGRPDSACPASPPLCTAATRPSGQRRSASPTKSGRDPTPETQYRIGSITKTFTAAAVLLLRDHGKLDLDDPIVGHLPDARFGDLTLRRLLAHRSGIQREPPGEVWETLEFRRATSSSPAWPMSSSSCLPGNGGTTRTSHMRCSARASPGSPTRRSPTSSTSVSSGRSASPARPGIRSSRPPAATTSIPTRGRSVRSRRSRGRGRGGRKPVEHSVRLVPLGEPPRLARGDAPGADHGRP